MIGNPGNPKKPIYTTDPNDPRLKAYNDSLMLFNAMEAQKKIMPGSSMWKSGMHQKGMWSMDELKEGRKDKYVPSLGGYYSHDFKSYEDMSDPSNSGMPAWKESMALLDKYRELGVPDDYIMFHTSPDVIHPTIEPYSTYDDGTALSPLYAKPKQPVELKEKPSMTKAPILSGLLKTGTLDKHLVDVILNPIMNNRPSQTIYKSDPTLSTGQYPVGERHWNNKRKSWWDDYWDKDTQKTARDLIDNKVKF